MKKIGSVFIFIFLFSFQIEAALKTEVVSYKHGSVPLQGFLVYDDALGGKRPGVLVVHEWWGHDEYVRKRAEQLAGLGYVAFALDMYGKGVLTDDPKKAGELAGAFKNDRQLMRGRANAGLKILRNNALVDSRRIAAMGYCFGGTVALELARAGADLVGVVSFHGGLSTPEPAQSRSIRSKILVLHGGVDPYVPQKEVEAFQEEMSRSGADWQLISYGGTVHGFTNPKNGMDNSKGAAYNEAADRRSWQAMQNFFGEIFK